MTTDHRTGSLEFQIMTPVFLKKRVANEVIPVEMAMVVVIPAVAVILVVIPLVIVIIAPVVVVIVGTVVMHSTSGHSCPSSYSYRSISDHSCHCPAYLVGEFDITYHSIIHFSRDEARADEPAGSPT